MPASHAPASQGAALCQAPVASQVSTPPSEQAVWPGAHAPAQAPDTQAWFTQATGLAHTPLVLHVSTLLPVHCVDPGVQTQE